MSDNIRKLFEILSPELTADEERIKNSDHDFVHYTTPAAAMNIIKNGEVWMRHTSVMNDFMELSHGWNLLLKNYNKEMAMMKSLYNEFFPGQGEELEKELSYRIESTRRHMYVLSLSEHLPTEDRLGRLSMWRAYGGSEGGVAIVLDKSKFFSEEENNLPFVCVSYDDDISFESKFAQMVSRLRENKDFISTVNVNDFLGAILMNFMYTIAASKHQGFHEEKEWRVLYLPKLLPLDYMKSEVEVINGVAQELFKFKVDDLPSGISIANAIKHFIIGPTEYPVASYDAFYRLLSDAGVEDVGDKLWASNIPLRT